MGDETKSPKRPQLSVVPAKPFEASAIWNDAASYLSRAVAGDKAARSQLVRALTPIVHVRVHRALMHRKAAGRDTRQEIEDLVQDVLVTLFAEEARILRLWDPARGMSFANYVGLIAERETSHRLKSKRRSPWSQEPSEERVLEAHAGTVDGPDKETENRQTLGKIWAGLKEQLTPRGFDLFERLFLQEQTVERVCDDLGMQPNAVHVWRNRLIRRARTLLPTENGEPPSDPETDAPRPLVEDIA